MIEVLSLILGFFGAISLIVYCLHWWVYSPKLFIRIGGEKLGDPIPVAKEGRIDFACGTDSSRKSGILEVLVSFDPEKVELFRTKGVAKEITVDRKFPMAVVFRDKKEVVRKVLQTNFFDYQSRVDSFAVKITVISEIDPSSLPFLLTMFSPRKVRSEKIVRFLVKEGASMDLKTHGVIIGPKESMQVVGVQSQEAVWAATSKGEATVKIMEVFDE